MSDDYTPRDGTTAHKILEFLRKQDPGSTFTSQQLSAKVKVKNAGMALRKAVEAGIVDLEKSGNTYLYSLPAPPPARRRAAADRGVQRWGCERRGRHTQPGRQRDVHARPAGAAHSLRHAARRGLDHRGAGCYAFGDHLTARTGR